MYHVKIKKFSDALTAIATAIALILFLIFPAHYSQAIRDGISLWAVSILPSVFPFIVLCALFSRQKIFNGFVRLTMPVSQRIFRISGAGCGAALISMISGYPVGARTVSNFYVTNQIPRHELLRTCALASTSGPAFLVGAVGCGMFHSAEIGWIIYFSHILGVMIICFLLRFPAKKTPIDQNILAIDTPTPFGEVISSSVLSILCVGGIVALFNAFGEMIADMGMLFHVPEQIIATLRGMLEMTSGCAAIAKTTSPLSLALCCFFVTFGGLCVLLQQFSFLSLTGVSKAKFCLIKFLQGMIAAIVCFVLATAIEI